MTCTNSFASSWVGCSATGNFFTVECFGTAPEEGAVVKGSQSFCNSSTACRNEIPSAFITQSITVPPAWQAPKQCHRFFPGVITSDGVRSSWKGQQPIRSAPWRLSSTPRASARRCTETSVFSRSTISAGIRAIKVLPKTCQALDLSFSASRSPLRGGTDNIGIAYIA